VPPFVVLFIKCIVFFINGLNSGFKVLFEVNVTWMWNWRKKTTFW